MKKCKHNIKKIIFMIFFITNIHSMQMDNAINSIVDQAIKKKIKEEIEDTVKIYTKISFGCLLFSGITIIGIESKFQHILYNQGIDRINETIKEIRECTSSRATKIENEINHVTKDGRRAYVISDFRVPDKAIVIHRLGTLQQTLFRCNIKPFQKKDILTTAFDVATFHVFNKNKKIAYIINDIQLYSITEKPLDDIIDII